MKPHPGHLAWHALAAGIVALALASAPDSWAEAAGDEDEDTDVEEVEEEAAGEEEVEEAQEDEEDEEAEEKPKKKKKKKKKKSKAKLLLPVSETGATIVIDGDEVGVSPMAPLTGLTVGTHSVEVTKEGFHAYLADVEIPDKGTVRHDVTLKGGKRKKIKVPKFLKSWWFWTAIGAAAAAGVGIGVAVHVQPEEPNAVSFPTY